MSTGAGAIVDQKSVNAAPDFDTAAASTLGLDANAFPETEASPAAENIAVETKAGEAAPTSGAPTEGAKTAEGIAAPAAAAAPADEFAFDAKTIEALLADPTHGAVVKGLYEKFTKAVELAKVWGPEGTEARALVPGGLGELKETVEIARTARQEAADFASGDPARQKTALLSVAEESPERFAAALPVYAEIVAGKNPAAFQSFVRGELTKSLEADGVTAALGAMFAAAKENPTAEDEKAFGEAFGALKGWFDKTGFTPAAAAKPAGTKAAAKAEDPEVAGLREKLAKYESGEKAATEQAWNSWSGETNTEISKQIREMAKNEIEGLFPANTEKTFKEFVTNSVLDKVEGQVIQDLTADLGHQQKLNAVLAENAWKKDGSAARTQVVNLQVGRGKLLLPRIIGEVAKTLKPAAQNTVDTAASKVAKEKAAAARADVTGAGGSPRPKTFGQKDIKQGGPLAKMTDEQILDMD